MTLGPVMLNIEGCELTDEDRRRLTHPQTGGIVLFSRNYRNPDQLAELVAREARPGPAFGRQPLLPLHRAAQARLNQERSGFTGRNRLLRKRRRHDPAVHEQGQQLRRRDHVRCRGNRLRYLGRSIRSASSLLRAGPDHLGVE